MKAESIGCPNSIGVDINCKAKMALAPSIKAMFTPHKKWRWHQVYREGLTSWVCPNSMEIAILYILVQIGDSNINCNHDRSIDVRQLRILFDSLSGAKESLFQRISNLHLENHAHPLCLSRSCSWRLTNSTGDVGPTVLVSVSDYHHWLLWSAEKTACEYIFFANSEAA